MSHYQIIELNYSDNLSNHYHQLAHLPGFVLLESPDRTQGRYDIVSAYPYDRLILRSDDPCIESAFSTVQSFVPQTQSSLSLPFQGGAIGYMSYDLGVQLEHISLASQGRLTSMPVMNLGLYDWAIIADHHLKKTILFSANTRSDTARIIDDMVARWQADARKSESFKLNSPFAPLVSATAYRDAFESIHRDLIRGRCYQVNLTQPFTADYLGSSWALYQQIRNRNPVPFSAFLQGDEGDILSFSPERFLLQEQQRLLVSPIKGTERRSQHPDEDEALKERLMTSKKNRAENVMIVDLLRNDLGKIAKPGSVHVKSLCELQSFSAVHHLVSHIEACCAEDISMMDAFKACFPGGSITGAPKRESMRVIAEQEPFRRGVYCGHVVYFSCHGRSDSNIAIRTITACNQTLHLAVGGGIVIDSTWENEYNECLTKIAAITQAIKVCRDA